jgi:hypothetical protein
MEEHRLWLAGTSLKSNKEQKTFVKYENLTGFEGSLGIIQMILDTNER